MQCTTCNSDNVQKLSLVFEQGTQNIKTRGRTYGGGGGFGGGGIAGALGSATTITTGKSQSIAARKAAPPAKKPIMAAVGIIAVGLIAMIGFHVILFGLIILGIGGFLFWKFYQYNKETFPPLYATWEKSWLCNKCGSIYVQ